MNDINDLKAYVISVNEKRMTQFRTAWSTVGLPLNSIIQWPGTEHCDKRIGNATAQRNAVQDAYDKGLKTVLIFEDDAVPCDNASQYLLEEIDAARPRGDALLRLGWIDIPPNPLQGNPNVQIRGTHAWALLSRDAMKDFLDHWAPVQLLGSFRRMTLPVNRSSKCLFAQYNAPDGGECISNRHYGWFASSSALHGNTTFDAVTEALDIKQRIHR